jgi:hypothetical protein
MDSEGVYVTIKGVFGLRVYEFNPERLPGFCVITDGVGKFND